MKVIIEASTLFTKGYTGIPHYILCLEKAYKKKSFIDFALGFNLKRLRKKKKLPNSILEKKYYWYIERFLFSRKFNPEISHSLHSPFLKIKGTKKIATIHDLAVHLPEHEHLDFTTEYFKKKRMKLFSDFAKNADAIISVSEKTKQDFLKFFNYPANKIHVIHLAPVFQPSNIDYSFEQKILNKYKLISKNYYLTVGGVSIRKNSINLLKGFANSQASKHHQLVYAGKTATNTKNKFLQTISELNFNNKIINTGYITDNELSILYKNAKGFLFPTYYEGFGIPIIEAMSYELPILTSTTGAAPEVANGHAILVNPNNIEEITKGIDKLSLVDTKQLKLAKEYASTFNWDIVAQKTIEIYKSVLQN